jgi:hypothetical protein
MGFKTPRVSSHIFDPLNSQPAHKTPLVVDKDGDLLAPAWLVVLSLVEVPNKIGGGDHANQFSHLIHNRQALKTFAAEQLGGLVDAGSGR